MSVQERERESLLHNSSSISLDAPILHGDLDLLYWTYSPGIFKATFGVQSANSVKSLGSCYFEGFGVERMREICVYALSASPLALIPFLSFHIPDHDPNSRASSSNILCPRLLLHHKLPLMTYEVCGPSTLCRERFAYNLSNMKTWPHVGLLLTSSQATCMNWVVCLSLTLEEVGCVHMWYMMFSTISQNLLKLYWFVDNIKFIFRTHFFFKSKNNSICDNGD